MDFRTWAADNVGAEAADALARSAGILTYYHDPGELSAAFLWEPLVRGLLSAPPAARYPIGGWTAIVERLRDRALALGVDRDRDSRRAAAGRARDHRHRAGRRAAPARR